MTQELKYHGFLNANKFKHLLKSTKTKTAHIEFTSRCNLRCVFCGVSQPGYIGLDLDLSTIEETVRVLKERNVEIVSVNGHGETSIFPEWYKYCNKMLDYGISLHIISNFAKKFTAEEVKTLSHFKDIEISCDTADPELFKQLRRGADLKALLLNIEKIRSEALSENREPPFMSFSCVVNDKNVLSLKDYVSFGIDQEIKYFNFCNLTKYPDVEGAIQVNHVSEMPLEFVKEAEQILKETFRFLRQKKIDFGVQKGLMDSLQQKLTTATPAPINNLSKPLVGNQSNEAKAEPKVAKIGRNNFSFKRYALEKQTKQTRDCLDPWRFVLIGSNKDISPCCWHSPIYTLSDYQSLDGVLNNLKFQELRYRLLSGDLPPDCANCPTRSLTSIKKLQKKVALYLMIKAKNPLFQGFFKRRGNELNRYNIKFEEGWYTEETNPGALDPILQNWRWTGKEAKCIIEAPEPKLSLIIQGALNESIYMSQKVIFKLEDQILDEFIPTNPLFFKQYSLPGNYTKNGSFRLTIETDKIFVPASLAKNSTDNRELGIQIFAINVIKP